MKPFTFILLSLLFSLQLKAFELPNTSKQLLLGISNSWNSSKAQLQLFEKRKGKWVSVASPWPARLGKSGLAWGRGIHPIYKGMNLKREGDKRAPAGVFYIGGAFGYEVNIQKNAKLYYKQVTKRDLWVEDSKSPHYNKHILLDHEPSNSWEKKQQMRQGDYAHSLKLFVAHNAPPKAVPGGGSAIFFHIWRGGGSKPTAGCTTMNESKLRNLIAWIDPEKRPLYVLLPKAEYEKLRKEWQLP